MRAYWHNLQGRERLVLVVGSAVSLGLLLYALVWHPMTAERERLRTLVADQQELLAWMEVAAAQVRQLRDAGASAGDAANDSRSLLTRVDASTRQMGLADRVKRLEPEGQEAVLVHVEGVAFDDLIRWLAVAVEHEGMVTRELAVERIEGAGQVDARLRLARRGPP